MAPQNTTTVSPVPTGTPVPTPAVVDPIPDCEQTIVPINLQLKPVLDVTICKPQVVITNYGVCIPNCEQ